MSGIWRQRIAVTRQLLCQGLRSCDQSYELHHFMKMYNSFLKARVSLRTLFSLVINLFTQVAIVLELALVSSQFMHVGIWAESYILM
jgi:hypothetical protein